MAKQTITIDINGGPITARPTIGEASSGTYALVLYEKDGFTKVKPSPWKQNFDNGNNEHLLPGTPAANDGRLLHLLASVGVFPPDRLYAIHLTISQDGKDLGTASDVGADAGTDPTHESTAIIVALSGDAPSGLTAKGEDKSAKLLAALKTAATNALSAAGGNS